MVLLLRVDHRMMHGQVAFSWTQNLGADCILIANDAVASDELRKTTMKLAKPQGVKLVIKNVEDGIIALNSGVTDKYKLFIVVESVEDAYKIASKVKSIQEINLGGIKSREGSRNISKTINLTEEEEKQEEKKMRMLRKLTEKGIEIEIRQLPADSKIIYK